MVIVGVLLAGLTHASGVGAERHAALHEALIRVHLQEIEGVHEIVQALESAQELPVLFGIRSGIANRVEAVELVEAATAADNELPCLHARIGYVVALIPGLKIIR